MTRLIDTSLPSLVMLPGTLCDAHLFAEQIKALPVDIRVGDLSRSTTIEALADDVLMNAPPTFALAGLSLGGIVAAEIVRKAPERVLGLALLDTNLQAASPEQSSERTRWVSDARAGHFATVVAENLVRPLTADPVRHGAAIFEMAMRVGVQTFGRQTQAILSRPDRAMILEDIRVPVLIACGSVDRVTPPSLHEELASRCPSGQLVVIPDAGHLSTIDQPAALNKVLGRWLKTCKNNKQEGIGNEHNFA